MSTPLNSKVTTPQQTKIVMNAASQLSELIYGWIGRCTLGMARPMELSDLLSVVRLTRGGGPRNLVAAAAADGSPFSATNTSGAGPVTGIWDAQRVYGVDDKQGGKGWGWPSATMFKRKGAGTVTRTPEQIQTRRETGSVPVHAEPGLSTTEAADVL